MLPPDFFGEQRRQPERFPDVFQLWWYTMNLPKEWIQALNAIAPCEWWGWGHCPYP